MDYDSYDPMFIGMSQSKNWEPSNIECPICIPTIYLTYSLFCWFIFHLLSNGLAQNSINYDWKNQLSLDFCLVWKYDALDKIWVLKIV